MGDSNTKLQSDVAPAGEGAVQDVTQVDLVARLAEQEAAQRAAEQARQEAARRAEAEAKRAAKEQQHAGAHHVSPQPGTATSDQGEPHGSNRLLILLTVLGVVLVGGLGAYYFLASPQSQPTPAVVAPTKTPGSPVPSGSPVPKTLPAVTVEGGQAAPTGGQRTYVVQTGDTLITIAERFGKDWRAIAAANGNIQDPNFISPGETLVIP